MHSKPEYHPKTLSQSLIHTCPHKLIQFLIEPLNSLPLLPLLLDWCCSLLLFLLPLLPLCCLCSLSSTMPYCWFRCCSFVLLCHQWKHFQQSPPLALMATHPPIIQCFLCLSAFPPPLTSMEKGCSSLSGDYILLILRTCFMLPLLAKLPLEWYFCFCSPPETVFSLHIRE